MSFLDLPEDIVRILFLQLKKRDVVNLISSNKSLHNKVNLEAYLSQYELSGMKNWKKYWPLIYFIDVVTNHIENKDKIISVAKDLELYSGQTGILNPNKQKRMYGYLEVDIDHIFHQQLSGKDWSYNVVSIRTVAGSITFKIGNGIVRKEDHARNYWHGQRMYTCDDTYHHRSEIIKLLRRGMVYQSSIDSFSFIINNTFEIYLN